jgi:hypothetical protein
LTEQPDAAVERYAFNMVLSGTESEIENDLNEAEMALSREQATRAREFAQALLQAIRDHRVELIRAAREAHEQESDDGRVPELDQALKAPIRTGGYAVDLLNQDRADYLVQTVLGESGGVRRPDSDGTVVTLSRGDLGMLANLDSEDDGHYDGTRIWIGGAEFEVNPLRQDGPDDHPPSDPST